MVNKNNRIVIATFITLLLFITIAYVSCVKTTVNVHSCSGVICQNGGYCLLDTTTKKPSCLCPTGFDGVNCSNEIVGKYVGTWDVKQTVTYSYSVDYTNDSGVVSNYIVFLKKSGTPTTFFIDNFSGNPYYNEMVCSVDSGNSYYFNIDTISAFHMIFDNYKVTWGVGSISPNDSVINASMFTKHLNAFKNWVYDSVSMVMTRH